jgi:aminoglycoside phosphotransferase (APT) family kinase protein
MHDFIDLSTTVRPGEELPLTRLDAYLRMYLPGPLGTLTIEQFPHGHSNLTYLLRLDAAEWVLRRPPFGNVVKTAHDMGREYRVLSKLSAVYPPAPKPLLYCQDESIVGSPFYIMERRRGVVLRKTLPPGLVLAPATVRQLDLALIDNLARLHKLDYRQIGLADLGKPEGYVARQVTGWINRYTQSRTDDLPAMERLTAWLPAHMPAESGVALVHNDYKFDNLVLDPSDLMHIVAVLDWEMATIGDPLMDLGTTLGYWVQSDDPAPMQAAAFGPTNLPGSLTRRELVERYTDQTERAVADVVFYYAFGLFKIAVIIQQIYARFVRGHTQDARFGRLNEQVAILSEQADRAVTEDRI